MSLRRLMLGVGSAAADKLIVAGIQLVLIPVLANSWGLTLFGIWAVMYTLPAFLVMTDFGIVTAAWARMTRFVSLGEMEQARATLHTAWLAGACVLAFLAPALGAVLYFLPDGIVPTASDFGEDEARLTLFLLVLYGLLMIPFKLNTTVAAASNRWALSTWCSTLSFAAENGALVLVVLGGGGLLTAAAVTLAMRCVALLVTGLANARWFPLLVPGFAAADRGEWRELWRPALSTSLLALGLLGFLQGSVVALGIAAGAAAVPAFVAVRTVSRLALQATVLIVHPVSQEFGREMARGQHYKAGRYFGFTMATSLALALCIALAFVAVGKPAVLLWTGGAIDAPYALIVLMAIASVLGGLFNALLNFLLVTSRHEAIALPTILAGAGGLLLILLLGGRMGSVAAGLAFAFTELVSLAAAALFIGRHWWRVPDFRAGSLRSAADMRSPLATLRALRSGEA